MLSRIGRDVQNITALGNSKLEEGYDMGDSDNPEELDKMLDAALSD